MKLAELIHSNFKKLLFTLRWYLSAIWADLVQGARRAVQEADDLYKVVIADAPGTVHQEDQVGSGRLTD